MWSVGEGAGSGEGGGGGRRCIENRQGGLWGGEGVVVGVQQINQPSLGVSFLWTCHDLIGEIWSCWGRGIVWVGTFTGEERL